MRVAIMDTAGVMEITNALVEAVTWVAAAARTRAA